MNSDTQPLTMEQQASYELAQQTLARELRHVHGPFTFLMNQNHNALRGCVMCGQTWVGVMAGIEESDLCWHEVAEPEEDVLE